MFAAACSGTTLARAEESGQSSTLSWVRMPGAEDCPSTQAVARAVEDRVGHSVFSAPSRAELAIEGRIEPQAIAGFRVTLMLRDARGAELGVRTIERSDPSCEAMIAPAALVISVMLDPNAMAAPALADAPAPAPAHGPISVALPRETIVSVPHAAPAQWRFEGTAHAAVARGLTPDLAWGAGGGAILFAPNVPIGLRGEASLFVPTSAEERGARADFDMVLSGGFICPTLERGRARWMACAGGHAGILRARTVAPLPAETLRGLLDVAFELRTGVRLVGPLAFGAGIGAALPIFRPQFDVPVPGGPSVTVHHVSAVALSADVGVGVFFP